MATKIIWIEDDANIIWPVVQPLEDRGYEIIALQSMREALDNIDDLRTCDLILLDVILPAGDKQWESEHYMGVHLLEELRERSVTTPVIVLTVVGNSGTRKVLRELGVNDILNKPILPSKLEEAVLTLLQDREN